MADYKKLYLTLFKATEEAINELVAVQRACEELYILSEEAEEKKAETIKIREKQG